MEIQSPYHVPRKQADGVDMCLSSPQPCVSLHAPSDKWRKGRTWKLGSIMAQSLRPACKFVHYIEINSLMWKIIKGFGLGFDIGSWTMEDFVEGMKIEFVWN